MSFWYRGPVFVNTYYLPLDKHQICVPASNKIFFISTTLRCPPPPAPFIVIINATMWKCLTHASLKTCFDPKTLNTRRNWNLQMVFIFHQSSLQKFSSICNRRAGSKISAKLHNSQDCVDTISLSITGTYQNSSGLLRSVETPESIQIVKLILRTQIPFLPRLSHFRETITESRARWKNYEKVHRK